MSAQKQKSQPFSIRLSRAVDLLVSEEMNRTGRSRSAVVEDLAEEAAKMRIFPGIGFRGPEPRRAWVMGTGLDVWEIVEMYQECEGDVQLLVEDYESLSERAIKLALVYAERFPDEIEARLAANRRPLSELLELYPFVQVVYIDE